MASRRQAAATLPAKPTPWNMGAETPVGVRKEIRDTSSLEDVTQPVKATAPAVHCQGAKDRNTTDPACPWGVTDDEMKTVPAGSPRRAALIRQSGSGCS